MEPLEKPSGPDVGHAFNVPFLVASRSLSFDMDAQRQQRLKWEAGYVLFALLFPALVIVPFTPSGFAVYAYCFCVGVFAVGRLVQNYAESLAIAIVITLLIATLSPAVQAARDKNLKRIETDRQNIPATKTLDNRRGNGVPFVGLPDLKKWTEYGSACKPVWHIGNLIRESTKFRRG